MQGTEADGVADAMIEANVGFDHRIGHFASMKRQKNNRLTPKKD